MARVQLASIAWRNLWRNRRRTLLTLVSMAFGIMLAVLFTGIGESSYSQMIDYSARLGSGHVTIQHADYADLPSLKRSVPDETPHRARAGEDPETTHVSGRITGMTMLSTARATRGAGFLAIDPSGETSQTLPILEQVSQGRMLEGPDDTGVVLGADLAEYLDVKLGKKVVYTLSDRNGDIVSGLARVIGLVKTGAPSLDGGLCLLGINAVRETLGYQATEVTQVAVFLADNARSKEVAERLRAAGGDGLAVLTWDQVSAELAGFIEMKRSGNVIFEVLMLFLIGAGIFNSLFVSVMERLREFGIMRAIGFGPRQIFGLVMWESAFMAGLGLVAGAIATAYPWWALSTVGLDMSKMVGDGMEVAGVAMQPILYVAITQTALLLIGGVTVAATLAAGLYPAWRAGRVSPVEAIKLV